MLTHANLSFMVVSWLADLGCGHEDVALHSTPLSHAAGFHSLVVTAAGGHNAIFPSTRFETGLMLEALAETRATDIHLVPTQVKMLLDDPAFGSCDLSALETIFYGAAPYALPDLKEAIELLGPERMVQLYAQGETPMTATFLPRSEHIVDGEGTDAPLSSVGYPRTGMEVRVASEDGDRLPAGEVGEVTVRGPAVMKGYWNAPEASAEALRDGWLHTGDLGRFDDRGRLHLAGRLKDVINSGGSNIYAIEVENVLLTHPDVHAATVVGIPDPKWGESVLAVLVADGSVALDPDSVDRHCRSHLGSYKVPKRYEIVTELPRNAVGKVLKRELRDRFA
jgi:long-chain acyl-CoA synthetase